MLKLGMGRKKRKYIFQLALSRIQNITKGGNIFFRQCFFFFLLLFWLCFFALFQLCVLGTIPCIWSRRRKSPYLGDMTTRLQLQIMLSSTLWGSRSILPVQASQETADPRTLRFVLLMTVAITPLRIWFTECDLNLD